MNFVGAAKRLDDVDLPRLGARIGVGEDELHALIDVESRGRGFDDRGRPLILFEPHVFYRCLPVAKRAKAVSAGLAYAKWKKGAYGPESAQYGKLERAVAIDETAALKACSWGMFQVLGENHKSIGFSTVQAMVEAMKADEENHLKACIDFIIANKIDDDLRAHRWTVVARVYNGPGYKANGYDTKLAAAFKKWRRIPDTKWSPTEGRPVALVDVPEDAQYTSLQAEAESPGSPPVPLPAEPPAPGIPPALLVATKKRLREKGYFSVGLPEPDVGPVTIGAISRVQATLGLPVTGQLDDATMAAIWSDDFPNAPVAAERLNISTEDLKANGNPVATAADQGKAAADTGKKVAGGVGALAGLATLGSAVMDFFGDAWAKLEPVRDAFNDIPGWVWGLAAMGVCWVIYQQHEQSKKAAEFAEAAELEAVRTGRQM